MKSSLKSLLAGTGLVSMAAAVTPISDSDMNNLLNAGGVELAMRAQPMWFFGQAMNQPPCIPTFATRPDNSQTPSAALCAYPNVGCNCRQPGVGIVNPAPSFPTYYSYQKCTDTTIRVQYSLFYEKDGTTPQGILGHPYDWERVIVEWAKGSDGNWTQSRLLLSQHSGYDNRAWSSIQNTLNTADGSQQIGGSNGRQNLDHPKVYVAWSKHANYNDRNTGWNDPLSQLDNNAFRSQDWWYFPVASDYLRADGSTALGQLLGSLNWGDASSNPPSVHNGLCSA
ncbi:necrosis inducing [Trichoderma arundinaceum]|uniref:Necrosis inducing n=1 Tax=Trichoderma arundinaceum TaxID=490622 RepID=A0A395P0F9_TRIAR|nr:necrosis inducing [Trichoderma arundinaceum]